MATLKLYGIPNCNTVKKARDWLEKNQIAYEFHDFKKQGVSTALLENWLTQIPREQLINRAGLTWRGLQSSVKERVVDNASAIALMQAKSSVIKRPIVEKNGKIICLGFDEANYKESLK
jgi:Spx/MgsR family transcriptional regulator